MNESKIDVVADALAKVWREGGVVSPLAEELWHPLLLPRTCRSCNRDP